MSEMKKINFSGISLYPNIQFVGDKKQVSVNTRNGEFEVTDSNTLNWKTDFLLKIPFIRGPYSLLKLFASNYTFKQRMFIAVLIIPLILLKLFSIFPFNNKTTTSISPTATMILFVTLNIIFPLVIFFWIFLSREIHGIEHRIITSYEKGHLNKLDEVIATSPIQKRCGGVIVVYLIPLTIIMPWLLALSIACEAAFMARRNDWIGELFFWPGKQIQKLTTTKTCDHIKVINALKGFNALLKEEGALA